MPEEDRIVALEKAFWDALVSRNASASTAMMAPSCIVAGPQGLGAISPEDFRRMLDGAKWTLDRYSLSDVHVVLPAENTAVIGYKVKQTGTMDGTSYDFEAADTSAWVRNGEQWLCVLHTETMLGDPFAHP